MTRQRSFESQYIGGIHDWIDGRHIPHGWVTITESIGADPNNHNSADYRHIADRGLGVIVRLNYSYDRTGCIPSPNEYNNFAQRVQNFVYASKGCFNWIIGNEPNLHIGNDPQIVSPAHYGQCWRLCQAKIDEVQHSGNVMIAGPGPWNNQTPYAGNPGAAIPYGDNLSGDWLLYLRDTVIECGVPDYHGVALHTYTHGGNHQLITSQATMNAPFNNHYYHFPVLWQFLSVLADIGYTSRPIHVTETNDDDHYRAMDNQWVDTAYRVIDDWNRANPTQVISSLCFFRALKGDSQGWEIPDRIYNDIARNSNMYTWPDKVGQQPQPPTPQPPDDGEALTLAYATNDALHEALKHMNSAVETNSQLIDLLEKKTRVT